MSPTDAASAEDAAPAPSAQSTRRTPPASSPAPASARGVWKTRLSEQQLRRKRTVDRETHRETRAKTRQTIQTLEARLRMLAEGQNDALIIDLLRQNAELEQQRDALRGRYDAIAAAIGLSPEESRLLEARQTDPLGAHSATVLAPSSQQAPTNPQSGPPAVPDPDPVPIPMDHRSPVDVELDLRMKNYRHQPSVFKNMSPYTVDIVQAMKLSLSDDDLVESIMQWQLANVAYQNVYILATELLNIHLAPTSITEADMVDFVSSPSFSTNVLSELLPDRPVSPPKDTSPRPEFRLEPLQLKKRQAIAAALFSTRHWQYTSHKERLLMFSALYKIMMLLVLPTMRNLQQCPPWYRPVPAQFTYPHPSYVDLLPWPLLRNRLVHCHEQYEQSDLISKLLSNLVICKPLADEAPAISIVDSEIKFSDEFEAVMSDSSSICMSEAFILRYPELAPYVNSASATTQPAMPCHQSHQASTTCLPAQMCEQSSDLDFLMGPTHMGDTMSAMHSLSSNTAMAFISY